MIDRIAIEMETVSVEQNSLKMYRNSVFPAARGVDAIIKVDTGR